MPTIKRTVTTSADADAAFEYLADFENATEWDSGTETCTRTSGDGGPGTTYDNVSRFAGRKVELEYTVERRDKPVFVITGTTPTTTSKDTIVVTPNGSGSSVEYTADFTFKGWFRLLTPVMIPLLKRLGDETEKTLAQALERLAGRS